MPALTQDQIDEIVSRRQAGEFQPAIAYAMGVSMATVNKYCQIAARQGKLGTRPVLDGFEITRITSKDEDGNSIVTKPAEDDSELQDKLLPGHIVERTTIKVGDDWYKTKRVTTVDPEEYAARMEGAFANFAPAAPITPVPSYDFVDQLTLYPWADPHFGMFAWRGDTGRNWDLKLAVAAVKDVFTKVVARSLPTSKATLLIGGDILHADDQAERTSSGHQLDVDGRFPKVVDAAGETAAWCVGLLLTHHEEVEVIVLPGNHDETSFYAITMFLRAWFRNEPRVTIDRSARPIRYREFGKVMLGMTHGHKAKAKRMPLLMAADEREMWGRTKYPYAHTFHVHHASKDLDEDGGVIVETHRVVAPADAWHYGQGYRSGRGLQSITYDRERGEVGRSVETL
jgi:hypothetical protein